MADLANIEIKITTIGHQQAEANINSIKSSGERAVGTLSSLNGTDFSGLVSNIRNVVAAIGGLYILEKVMSSWYSLIKGGILAVDDYQKKIIGTSYVMATMSIVPAPDLSKAYEQWTEFHKWLYSESIRVDKQSAASSGEIFAVALELEKKGVVANTRDKMETVGRFVDLMKGVIPTYASLEQQARGEIEAVLSGTTRIGQQTAQVLASIDPEFKKNIENARENNTVLEYFKSILPQIDAYTKQLMGTWDAVGASLKSAWDIVQIKAFGDAHKDIVSFAQQLGDKLVNNGALTAEGTKFAEALSTAWSQVKDQASQFVDYVLNNMPEIISNVKSTATALGTIASAAIGAAKEIAQIITQLRELAANPLTWAVLGGAAGARFGPLGAAVGATIGLVGGTAIQTQSMLNQTQGAVDKVVQQKNALQSATEGLNKQFGLSDKLLSGAGMGGNAPPVPAVRPFQGKEPKGGGGGDGGAFAQAGHLASLFDTLTKDISRLSEGKLSEIQANYEKTVDQIYNKTEVRAVTEAEVEVLANKRKILQMTKAEEDYAIFVGKNSGNQYLEIDAQAKKWLTDYKGFKDSEKNIAAITARQKTLVEVNQYTEVANLQKTYVDAMASGVPLLADQIKYKKESLQLENDLAQAAITTLMAQKPNLKYLEDELRGRQAIVNEVKKYNIEKENWMTQDITGGLKSGSLDREKEAATRTAQWTIDAMKGAEQYLGETAGNFFVDTIHGKKADLSKLFSDLGDSLIKKVMTMGVTKLFDTAWGGIGKALGVNKEVEKLGTWGSPMWVKIKDAGELSGSTESFDRSITKAEKTGFTMPSGAGYVTGGGKGGMDTVKGLQTLEREYTKYFNLRRKDELALDKLDDKMFKEEKGENKFETKDWIKMQQQKINASKDFYGSEKEGQSEYETNFGGFLNNISNIWLLGQAAMTAAGVQGDTARIVSMAGFGLKAVAIIWNIVQNGLLAKAWEAAAGAYASVWASVGFPVAVALAPAMAAVAFAGTLMAGGGAGGGGGGSQIAERDTQAMGGVWYRGIKQAYATGGIVNRPTYFPMVGGMGLMGEAGPEAIMPLTRGPGGYLGVRAQGGGEGGGTVVNNNVSVSIHPRQEMTQADYDKHSKMVVRSLNRALGKHGKQPLGRTYG